MTKLRRRWAIAGGMTLIVGLIGYFALAKAIDHFLKEGAVDRLLGKKTAVILQADAGYLPLDRAEDLSACPNLESALDRFVLDGELSVDPK